MKAPPIDAVKLCDTHMEASITVRRVHELRLRCWLAKRLVLLAAWIMPGIWRVIEQEGEGE